MVPTKMLLRVILTVHKKLMASVMVLTKGTLILLPMVQKKLLVFVMLAYLVGWMVIHWGCQKVKRTDGRMVIHWGYQKVNQMEKYLHYLMAMC